MDVAAKLKIMPESPEVDLEKLREEIQAKLRGIADVKDFKEEPIAFGIKALILLVMVDDAEGGTDKVEETISALPAVESVQVIDVSRI